MSNYSKEPKQVSLSDLSRRPFRLKQKPYLCNLPVLSLSLQLAAKGLGYQITYSQRSCQLFLAEKAQLPTANVNCPLQEEEQQQARERIPIPLGNCNLILIIVCASFLFCCSSSCVVHLLPELTRLSCCCC